MLVRNVEYLDLHAALDAVNEKYKGNVQFNRIDRKSTSRGGGYTYAITLRVKSSKGPGARRSWGGRRLVSACWHVHGMFIDALPEHATIITAHGTVHPGDRWIDKNVGSQYKPAFMSELCDCT